MIYIIIPVHNRKHFTRQCLMSLREQTVQQFRTVVIDDGSTDGTSEMIQTEFPEVKLLRGDGNLWWTGATNLGVEYALDQNAHYIMTLNDDTIPTSDFIGNMLKQAKRHPNTLLGALAIDAETRQPVYGGEIINWKRATFRQLLDINPPEKLSGLVEVTHFPGRGLFIPASVFSQIGIFDVKNFPQYAADYDFTHRAIRAGFRVCCNYDARLMIYPQASGDRQNRSRKSWKNYRNHLFGMKGGGNLIKFSIYAIKNCPKKYLPLFLFHGILRRISGYLIEWYRESNNLQQFNKQIVEIRNQ